MSLLVSRAECNICGEEVFSVVAEEDFDEDTTPWMHSNMRITNHPARPDPDTVAGAVNCNRCGLPFDGIEGMSNCTCPPGVLAMDEEQDYQEGCEIEYDDTDATDVG